VAAASLEAAAQAAARGIADVRQRVEPILATIVSEMGLDLIELRLAGSPRRSWRMAIFIDRLPGEGSVRISECTSVSRRLSAVLDVDDPFDAPWELEVSSPGMSRLLRDAADMLRFAEMTARFALLPTDEGARESVIGRITACANGQVTLNLKNGQPRLVALSDVERAELNPTADEWAAMGERIAAENAARQRDTLDDAETARPATESQGEA